MHPEASAEQAASEDAVHPVPASSDPAPDSPPADAPPPQAAAIESADAAASVSVSATGDDQPPTTDQPLTPPILPDSDSPADKVAGETVREEAVEAVEVETSSVGAESQSGPKIVTPLTPGDKAGVLIGERAPTRAIPEELVSKGAALRSDMPDAHTPRGAASTASVAASMASAGRERGPGQHFDAPPSHLSPNQPPHRGGADAVGGQHVGRVATWNSIMAMRMVFVFDKPGGIGSHKLTGRLIIRRAGGEAASGAGEGADVDGKKDGETEEVEEVVVNGEFVRVLQDEDVQLFEVRLLAF